jgi:integrative and conjugative element protein (TIGR02256 family)
MKLIVQPNVLDEIFEECERHPTEETGGRLLGVYDTEICRVVMTLGPGPRASRTRTSFFQDGEWQENEFRRIEKKITNIEHLGNWHTHHPNGLEVLSQGDVDTYQRTLASSNWRLPFFLSILVQKRHGPKEYNWRYDFLGRKS